MYRAWFRRLLDDVAGRTPVVELGAGPGFLKELAPSVLATDVLSSPWLDLRCDGTALPFRAGAVGALVMVDTLHHLAQPLAFFDEAARVLRPGGRIAMMEPWVTAASFLLYRFFHQEQCRLDVDVRQPFGHGDKAAMDGNVAIPQLALRALASRATAFRLVRLERIVALPYLATFGFKCARPLPRAVAATAGVIERPLALLAPLLATRAFVLLERTR